MRSIEGTRRTPTGQTSGRARRARGTAPLILALTVPLLLAACGGDDSPPTPTAAAAATAPLPPPPAGAASATPTGEPRTLGELADRIDAAWAGIGSFRSVFVAEGASLPVVPAPVVAASPFAASPTASPVASPPASPVASPPATPRRLELAREVLLPDRQHLTERADGTVVSEALAVGGRIYVRGRAAALLLPRADPSAWVETDPATVAAIAATDPLLARLAAPITSPAAALPDNLRPQELRPLGPVEVAGRVCRAFAAANTTELGTRIDITFAIDAADRPCFVETRSGAVGGRETFEAYDPPLTIEAPTGALPASPPALPATPVGRD